MATPSARKPLPNITVPSVSPRRIPNDSNPGRPPNVPNSATGVGQGISRTTSLRRPGRRSTARMSTSLADSDLENDEDEKNANLQLVTELKESLQRAEQMNEQYRKQLEGMMARLDESTNQQTLSEERDFHRQTEIDHLKAEIKESARQRRELQLSHDSETRLILQERDEQSNKINEMQSTIGRLNETLRNKNLEKATANRAASMPVTASPTEDSPPQATTESVEKYIRLLKERDAVVESMRLELAEVHLTAAEQNHVGDGQLQDLEKHLLETKMQNARLIEENESFQMLLSEKTLKGDFAPEAQDSTGLNTLAEELESYADDPEAQSEAFKKLEGDNKQLRESNKALTLYVDKIIGRILQHEGYEHIIVGKDDQDSPPPPPSKPVSAAPTEKALPPPPGQENATPPTGVQGAAAGFLQRARSVVSRTNPGRPSRPMSYAQPAAPTANENPETAPSIPLNRGHRRARSDQAQQDLGAAAVVQQMNRGSPLRTVSGGPMSPGISPLSPQLSGKPGYFPALSQASTRAPSGSHQGAGKGSSRNSVNSDHSQEPGSTDASSVQVSGSAPSAGPVIPGAVMKQNQLRPLRLVQAQSREEEEAQKRANRGSWMGWLKGSTIEAQQETLR